MRNTLTIAGKELQGYFMQPVAYVVLTVFLLLGGWFFFAMLRQFDEMVQLIQMMGQNDAAQGQMNLNTRVIDPLLHNLSIVLVIVMPAMTMRVFAEEKRTGTYELLLTAPIRTGEIVAGKFIAAASFTLIMIALAWIFPLILIIFGDPEVGVMFAGYVGLALLALSFRRGRTVHQFADAESDHRGDQLVRHADPALRHFVAGRGWRRHRLVGAALSFAARSFLDDGRAV